MSYTIAYGRVFFRSDKGITPCVLLGDNNEWDPVAKRRPRDWSVLNHFLGEDESAIRSWLDKELEGPDRERLYDPKKGAFMHNEGFRRWVENGLKKAVTLEEFCKANSRKAVACSLWRYRGIHCESSHRAWCSTSTELDAWIEKVPPLVGDWHPVILLPENPRSVAPWPEGKPFLLKAGDVYVQGVRHGTDGLINEVSYTRNVMEAKKFVSDDELNGLNRFQRTHRKVSAGKQEKPNNVVLRITDGVHAGRYVERRSGRRMRIASDPRYAQRFEDGKTAEKAKKSIEERYRVHCEPVVLLSNQNI